MRSGQEEAEIEKYTWTKGQEDARIRAELEHGLNGDLLAAGPFDSLVTSTRSALGRMTTAVADFTSDAKFRVRDALSPDLLGTKEAIASQRELE